jgi:hypothetical protein
MTAHTALAELVAAMDEAVRTGADGETLRLLTDALAHAHATSCVRFVVDEAVDPRLDTRGVVRVSMTGDGGGGDDGDGDGGGCASVMRCVQRRRRDGSALRARVAELVRRASTLPRVETLRMVLTTVMLGLPTHRLFDKATSRAVFDFLRRCVVTAVQHRSGCCRAMTDALTGDGCVQLVLDAPHADAVDVDMAGALMVSAPLLCMVRAGFAHVGLPVLLGVQVLEWRELRRLQHDVLVSCMVASWFVSHGEIRGPALDTLRLAGHVYSNAHARCSDDAATVRAFCNVRHWVLQQHQRQQRQHQHQQAPQPPHQPHQPHVHHCHDHHHHHHHHVGRLPCGLCLDAEPGVELTCGVARAHAVCEACWALLRRRARECDVPLMCPTCRRPCFAKGGRGAAV